MQENKELQSNINDLTNLKKVIMSLNKENQQLRMLFHQEQLSNIPEKERMLLESQMQIQEYQRLMLQTLKELHQTEKEGLNYQNRLLFELSENLLKAQENKEEVFEDEPEELSLKKDKISVDKADIDADEDDEETEENDDSFDDIVLKKLNAIENESKRKK